MIRRAGLWPLSRILTEWRPGSFDHSWAEEDADLYSTACWCPTPRTPEGIGELEMCDILGHYQHRIEQHMGQLGTWFGAPALLGPDGRIWDGHHRLVAARRLDLRLVPVEIV